MTDLNKEIELCNQSFEKYWDDFCEAYGNGFDRSLAKLFFANAWGEAKAQAVPDTHVLVEKSKIETWWQDAEEPENFASRIEDMPSLGHYLTGDEIMEITEHHTIHLPSKTIYGVWVDKDGDRSFCTGTLEECQALVASESGAEQ